jgi:hypothetical protein
VEAKSGFILSVKTPSTYAYKGFTQLLSLTFIHPEVFSDSGAVI